MPRFAELDDRYAAIDIGTNSTKMTAAEVSGGRIDILVERLEITRLGRGVDQTKRFAADAVEKTLDAIRGYVAEAKSLGIRHIAAGGTSAMRDSTNGEEFRRRAGELIGGEVEIVSGEREAQLTFLGALSDPSILRQASTVLAFDAGGGSTELIVGDASGIDRSDSLNIGAVRLTERILRSDPPSADELDSARKAIDETFSKFGSAKVDRIIGIGGTATTVSAMLSPTLTGEQGSEIRDSQLDALVQKLASIPLDQRRATPGLEPARADVIIAGMLIIRGILSRFGQPSFSLSLRGVRHGMLLDMAAKRGG